MYSDWRKHSQSAASLVALRKSTNTMAGSGVNNLGIALGTDTSNRRLAYVNDRLGSVSGVQFVEMSLRVPLGAFPVTIGVVAFWNDVDLDATDQAYVFEVQFIDSDTMRYVLRKGPHADGEVLLQYEPAALYATWQQLGLQCFYDSIGNLHLKVATRSGFNPTLDIGWVVLGETQILRTRARTRGKLGFMVTAARDLYQLELDHFRVRSEQVL